MLFRLWKKSEYILLFRYNKLIIIFLYRLHMNMQNIKISKHTCLSNWTCQDLSMNKLARWSLTNFLMGSFNIMRLNKNSYKFYRKFITLIFFHSFCINHSTYCRFHLKTLACFNDLCEILANSKTSLTVFGFDFFVPWKIVMIIVYICFNWKKKLFSYLLHICFQIINSGLRHVYVRRKSKTVDKI